MSRPSASPKQSSVLTVFPAKACAETARFFRQGLGLRPSERHTSAPLTARGAHVSD
jgi:hypothetical protein